MDFIKVYKEWLNNSYIDEKDKEELKSIKDHKSEIQDRFYKDLEFGTAGLRGKIGMGTNRMNRYIIAKVTQGLANFIKKQGKNAMDRGVSIAYDCRHYSDVFSQTAALVLVGNGIKTYLFEGLRPTPELSFTVRKLNNISGIVITASHNPKEYNGYKVYWEDGAQILSSIANPITDEINSIDDFNKINMISIEDAKNSGLLNIIGKEIDDEYIEKVKSLAIRDEIDKNIKVIYTPLNGTGNIPVRRVLKERGFNNIIVVPEQENPDPNFTTIGYPNPEDIKAFEYAEKLGKKLDAELLIATDPDCDRLAIMVRDKNGEYTAFNGNQTGAILINYILESKEDKGILPENGAIVKSIVTGDMGKAIAKEYKVKTFESLTGFKNICGVENKLENEGKYKFIFGYEESIGYVAGDFVRDKDGVISSMLLCEAAAYYRSLGKTLIDVLNELYRKLGFFREKLISLVLEGVEGQKRIERMMEVYRKDFPKNIGNISVQKYIDIEKGKEVDLETGKETNIELPKSNVLKFILEDECWYAIRPSGTEPKIKIYIYSKGKTLEEGEDKIEMIKQAVMDKLNSID